MNTSKTLAFITIADTVCSLQLADAAGAFLAARGLTATSPGVAVEIVDPASTRARRLCLRGNQPEFAGFRLHGNRFGCASDAARAAVEAAHGLAPYSSYTM